MDWNGPKLTADAEEYGHEEGAASSPPKIAGFL
jgi:hypothetical protein